MKKSFIKFFDKIILLLLGLSGIFYACAKYGMPIDEFEIKGKITDNSKKPIKNIRIIRKKLNYEWRGDTLYTNSDGKYSIQLDERHIDLGVPINLKIDDIDGEANGGEFVSTEIDVAFTRADLVKKGFGNKRGDKYVKIIDIKLNKEDEIIPLYGCPATPFEP